MPRVISSDTPAPIFTHHENGLSGQKYFGHIIFGWNVCIKARSQQNHPGNNAGEAESDEACKKAGESARSASTILKVKTFHQHSRSLATANDFAEAERPSHNDQADYRTGSGGGGSAIQAQNSSPVREACGSTARKGLRLLKHLIHNREMWWVLMKLGVICRMSMDGGRYFMSFAEKKNPESWRKFVYRNIHVELCSQRESAPLVPLPPVSSLPTQKSTPTST